MIRYDKYEGLQRGSAVENIEETIVRIVIPSKKKIMVKIIAPVEFGIHELMKITRLKMVNMNN